jgi:hypothetical protein
MDDLYEILRPLTDWIPAEMRDQVDPWVWWLVEFTLVLCVLIVAGKLFKAMLRGVFRRREIDWDAQLREDLDSCPTPAGPPGVAVHHYPARIRLVVVAPGGKRLVVPADVLAELLDRIVPGLGAAIERDQPRIRVWPAGLSQQGFTNTFHRCTPTGQSIDEPSHWVLLAGRARAGSVPLFVGLALWTDESTHLGRLNLDVEEWRGVVARTAS